MSMNFVTLFENYDWFSGTWIIHTALERWAILVVDSSGDVVPERWLRRKDYFDKTGTQAFRHHSPEQKKEWDRLNSNFYHRIMKRAEDYERTFATESIKTIRKYLTDIPAYDIVVQDSKIPENKIVAKIHNPHFINEQRDGLYISEYMLHLNQDDALSFLENLSIHWASSLPVNSDTNVPFEQGRSLYILAEQMESG
jgi:hypothetical protein